MTFLGFIHVLRKRWLTVLLVALLGVNAAVGISALLPKKYAAEARSFVNVAPDSDDQSAAYQSSQFAVQRVKSYTLLIDSPDVLDGVIDDLGLDTTTQTLSRQVSITNPLDTIILAVRAEDADPERAAEIANAVSKELARVIEILEAPRSDRVSPVQVSLTTPARTPGGPVSPNVPINVALGLLLGLAVGVTVAMAREYLDTTLRNQEAVVALTGQLPLAAVPIDPDARRRSPVALDTTSPLLESFRTLRSNLRFSNVDDPPHVMVVCSALSAEGKSTTAQNLAIALAQSGFRVCLLDADLRRPSIADHLGIEGSVGLTNVLIGEAELDDVLTSWHQGLLHVLPAGTIPSDPPTLLGSEHMRSLIADLRTRFEYVIIDAPPIVHVSDAVVLADVADGALFVIRAGRSRRDQVESSLNVLRSAGARLIGTVLTFAPSAGRYGYGSAVTEERGRDDETPVSAPGATGSSAPAGLDVTTSTHTVVSAASVPGSEAASQPQPDAVPETVCEPEPGAAREEAPIARADDAVQKPQGSAVPRPAKKRAQGGVQAKPGGRGKRATSQRDRSGSQQPGKAGGQQSRSKPGDHD